MLFRSVEKRKIEVAKFANDYVAANGKIDGAFYNVLAEWSEAHPMFTPEEIQKAESLSSDTSSSVPGLDEELRRRGL